VVSKKALCVIKMGDRKIFKVVHSNTFGRHIVANRNIEVGEIIIEEYPVVFGPACNTDESQDDPNTEPGQVCVGCCCIIDTETNTSSYKCPSCGLQLCSNVCHKLELHEQNEYLVFRNCSIISINPLLTDLKMRYNFILVLRAIFIFIRDPSSWEKVKTLDSQIPQLNKLGWFDKWKGVFGILSWKLFGQEDIKCDASIISIASHSLGAMRMNGFSHFSKDFSLEGLYFLSALMSHSCTMNTHRQFDQDGLLVVKAISQIKEGEPITNTYIYALDDKIERQRSLQSTWLFVCRCFRCTDPTEYGTYFSTVLCPSCGFLNLNPVNCVNESVWEWACSNETCLFKTHSPDTSISRLKCIKNSRPDFNDITKLEAWLSTFNEEKCLHKNHAVFTQVKLQLCQLYGRNVGVSNLSVADLRRKVSLTMEIDEVFRSWANNASLPFLGQS